MKQILLFCFLLITTLGFSQKGCPQSASFDSLQAFIKENYAGYNDKVNAFGKRTFDEHTAKHLQQIKKVKSNGQYFQVIHDWLKFFKDEHVSMSVPFDTANGKLAQAIAATEKHALNTLPLAALEKMDTSSIEGIYYTVDSTYKVAVIKNTVGTRQYAGIIVSSKAPEWKPGDLKFELIPDSAKKFDVIWYNKYHHPLFTTLDFTTGNTFYTEGWYKKGYVKNEATAYTYTPPFQDEDKYNAFFKQIDDQTSYLRISSFDASYTGEIDSVVKANKTLLETLPYLVIDIRGNGGGADIAYRPLKRLVYSDPVKSIGVDLLATPYNIDITIELINSIPEIPDSEKKEYNDILEKARKSGTRMFNFFADTTEVSEPLPFPKKVAVVMNSRCASTAEQFILEAAQSKKVTLFGTHTMGVLDYANVRDKTFCGGFMLHYPSTRSRRIDVGQGIDNKGIMPDVQLNLRKEGWLKEVVETLKK